MSKINVNEIGTQAGTDVAISSGKTVSGTASQFKMTDLVAGDVVYASANDTLGRVAKGTASQVLTMNSGATAPEWAAASGAGKVGQVVSTTKVNTFSSTTITNWADVTGLTLSITPSATTSKVFVMAHVYESSSESAANAYHYYRITRGGAAIGVGQADGSRTQIGWQAMHGNGSALGNTTPYFVLDTPSTTSATTYAVQYFLQTNSTLWINRTGNDSNNSSYGRGASSITLMEILA